MGVQTLFCLARLRNEVEPSNEDTKFISIHFVFLCSLFVFVTRCLLPSTAEWRRADV